MPSRSCRRRIMAIERSRLRLSTSATRARTDDRLEIASREALLPHAKLDRFDRIGRVDRFVLALVGVDQGRQHVEPIAFRRAGLGAPQTPQLGQGRLGIGLGADRPRLIAHAAPLSRRCGRRPRGNRSISLCGFTSCETRGQMQIRPLFTWRSEAREEFEVKDGRIARSDERAFFRTPCGASLSSNSSRA
jgi:hypothetical protein